MKAQRINIPKIINYIYIYITRQALISLRDQFIGKRMAFSHAQSIYLSNTQKKSLITNKYV